MPKHVDKPIRLHVLTIFIVIAYGFFPLVSTIRFSWGYLLFGPVFLPFNGSIQVLYDSNGEISLFMLVVTIALSLLTVGSAIIAFLGISEGRTGALIFSTLNVAWWSLIVVAAVLKSNDRPGAIIQSVLELLVPPVWLAVIWWNYTRTDISAYLKYMSETPS